MPEVLYAKAGGPPEDWRDLTVLLDGYELKGVLEVNADEGWAIVLKHETWAGAGCDVAETERLTGHIVIIRKPGRQPEPAMADATTAP